MSFGTGPPGCTGVDLKGHYPWFGQDSATVALSVDLNRGGEAEAPMTQRGAIKGTRLVRVTGAPATLGAVDGLARVDGVMQRSACGSLLHVIGQMILGRGLRQTFADVDQAVSGGAVAVRADICPYADELIMQARRTAVQLIEAYSDFDWLIEKFDVELINLLVCLCGHSQPRTHRGAERFPGMTITYALFQMLAKGAEKNDRVRIITKDEAST